LNRRPTSDPGARGEGTPAPPAAATQTLPLVPRAIRDGIVTMPGAGYGAVLEVGGINLTLLHPDELAGLASAYHGFLAGLSFPVQVLVRVQPADPAPYLQWYHAQSARRAATDPAVRWLVRTHLAHVARLVSTTVPVAHRFYVVVPAPETAPAAATHVHRTSRAILHHLPRRRRDQGTPAAAETSARAEALAERCGLIAAALAAIGVPVHRLGDAELADLWYGCLSPVNAALQPLPPEPNLAALQPLATLEALRPGHPTTEAPHSGTAVPP
jgi:hypothetical protein